MDHVIEVLVNMSDWLIIVRIVPFIHIGLDGAPSLNSQNFLWHPLPPECQNNAIRFMRRPLNKSPTITVLFKICPIISSFSYYNIIITVLGERYRVMLTNFLWPILYVTDIKDLGTSQK